MQAGKTLAVVVRSGEIIREAMVSLGHNRGNTEKKDRLGRQTPSIQSIEWIRYEDRAQFNVWAAYSKGKGVRLRYELVLDD